MKTVRTAGMSIKLLIYMALIYTGTAASVATAQAQEMARKIVILPFELVDSSGGAIPLPDKKERLEAITKLLREQIAGEKLYEVVHSPAIDEAIRKEQKRYDLRTCNGCDQDIAKVAGTDRIMVAWVQMVSNLILNLNIEVRDAATSQPLLNKSADIRGNTLSNWKRGVKYIVRSMVAKQQGNR